MIIPPGLSASKSVFAVLCDIDDPKYALDVLERAEKLANENVFNIRDAVIKIRNSDAFKRQAITNRRQSGGKDPTTSEWSVDDLNAGVKLLTENIEQPWGNRDKITGIYPPIGPNEFRKSYPAEFKEDLPRKRYKPYGKDEKYSRRKKVFKNGNR